MVIMAGCSLEKQSGFNRTMQNLTAHYNILFNAKEILRQKQESYAASFPDNYNEILNVYPDTTTQSQTPDKDLEEAIVKANKIINIKEQSNYLGDAYLVLGKANYLEGNYFNAAEFFGYVVRSFPKRADLTQDALAWQARSLIYLNELPQAKPVLDSAIKNINPKKSITADVYASKLQYDIAVQDYADGEAMAKQAISFCTDHSIKLRWIFILAQLQELNQKPTDAINNYAHIAGSNASFEMAFNASLNRIRIEDLRDGIKTNRTQRLLGLLKDPNNKEFKDQIYYQVGQIQFAGKDIEGAIKSYNLSLRYSLKNQTQKGISYLRLAEIYFKNRADYLTAKKYYDSTLTSLPVNYPGYLAIQKKGNNLQVLADKLQIITREDTLQSLAKMDEKTRVAVIDKMVEDRILQQQQATANAAVASQGVNDSAPQANAGGPSSFYFYNSNAVGQGYADFKRKWGNRKLEDNWRRSQRSNSDITNNSANPPSTDPFAPVQGPAPQQSATGGAYRQELVQGLPLTPVKLAQSNLRIYNAYLDMGNFYRDVLADKQEAIATYETMLRRFPDDTNKPALYYNLYRLYSGIDPKKSDYYKNILLQNYADTPFAKVIADPEYAKKLEDVNAAFTQIYNNVFDLYAAKKYPEVITNSEQVLKQYPNNRYAAQLYYLKTIAEGHNEKLGPFRDSLQQIVKRYPADKLITPLVNGHLAYINANQTEMLNREVVLADDNPQDVPFTLENALKKQTAYNKNVTAPQVIQTPQVKVVEQKPVAAAPAAPDRQAVDITAQQITQPKINAGLNKPVIKQSVIKTNLFSMQDSTNYYFVVNVSTATTNLSSSRFGIGQFDRANYAGKGIRHLLKAVGEDNQLIYVGRFFSLADVKKYAHDIIPLMPDIMKVPKDKYSFFIITQENLNKLADKNTLDSYIDFYQKNF
jgi:tetratricopeptide (TPR) repeat protein